MAVGKKVPDDGLILTAKLHEGTGVAPGWIELGTGTTTPADGDHGCATPVLRKLATKSRTGAEMMYEITVAPGELTADVTEFSLVNTASGVAECSYREVCAAQVCDGTHGAIFRVFLDWTKVS